MDHAYMQNEKVFFSVSLRPQNVLSHFKETISILFRKAIKEKIGDLTFYLEDNDNNLLDFNGEILTFLEFQLLLPLCRR